MESIRVATIGSGPIVESILNNINRVEGIYLEAVYSRSLERGKFLTQKFNCKKSYTSLEELFNDKNVNTIYIASPNSLHYEQAKLALNAGKHVICEKPFVSKLSQAEELSALATNKNLFLIEAIPTAFLPNLEVIKNHLRKIGKLKLVISNYSQYSSRYDKVLSGEVPNVFNPNFDGGSLMDINYYNIALNVLLFGKAIRAKYYPNIFENLLDTSGVALLEYPDFISTNVGAKDSFGTNFFQIEGEDGYIYAEAGANGLKSVKIGIKNSNDNSVKEEIYDEQYDEDRLYFEIKEITRLFLNNSYAEVRKLLAKSIDTVSIVEQMRLSAGIIFPCDKNFQ